MKISKETLKGYLLEEALAFLLKNTGYRLLVDPRQDPYELKSRGNGLVVIGRGGEHQADVLGQLYWIPTFTYPIRLFIEAKFRNGKTGIDVVRSAIGILEDLNQNYSTMRETRILVRRYHYNYAIFSTSGFSKNAVDMAIAHKISLIDLSGNDYYTLRNAIDSTANNIIHTLKLSGDSDIDETKESRGSLIKAIRDFLRKELRTWPPEIPYYEPHDIQTIFKLTDFFDTFIHHLTKIKELFVGMANGPFLLVLKADNPEDFINYARKYPTHKIHINWSYNDNHGRRWKITPYNSEDYVLSFTLPRTLEEFIFGSNNPTKTALLAKSEFLASITIYSYSEEKDEVFRLNYNNPTNLDHFVPF